MDILDGLFGYIIVYGLWVLLFAILFFAFIIWIIKKGVKKAIDETLLENEFHEQLKLDMKFAIISAYKEIKYSENKEEPTE